MSLYNVEYDQRIIIFIYPLNYDLTNLISYLYKKKKNKFDFFNDL